MEELSPQGFEHAAFRGGVGGLDWFAYSRRTGRLLVRIWLHLLGAGETLPRVRILLHLLGTGETLRTEGGGFASGRGYLAQL